MDVNDFLMQVEAMRMEAKVVTESTTFTSLIFCFCTNDDELEIDDTKFGGQLKICRTDANMKKGAFTAKKLTNLRLA